MSIASKEQQQVPLSPPCTTKNDNVNDGNSLMLFPRKERIRVTPPRSWNTTDTAARPTPRPPSPRPPTPRPHGPTSMDVVMSSSSSSSAPLSCHDHEVCLSPPMTVVKEETETMMIQQWKGMSPLDFVQEVASQGLSQQQSQGDMTKDDEWILSILAQPTMTTCPRRATRTSATVTPVRNGRRRRRHGRLTDGEKCCAKVVCGKRGRSLSDGGEDAVVQEHEAATGVTGILPPWDVSFLVALDPHPAMAQAMVHALEDVMKRLERVLSSCSCVSRTRVLSCLGRLREELTRRVEACRCPCRLLRRLDSEIRTILDKAYASTLHKMEALVEMARMELTQTRQGGKEEAEEEDPDGDLDDQETTCEVEGGTTPPRKSGLAAAVPMWTPERSKQDFVNFMTQWLRENWTNPYPDGNGFEEMARQVGTSSTVVSNWLINARTRKWRPAIAKAFDLERPADALLEDSIRVFDGKDVTPLHGNGGGGGGGEATATAAGAMDLHSMSILSNGSDDASSLTASCAV